MKFIKEEMKKRFQDRRQSSSGGWSSLIIKIALLVLVIWLVTNYRSEHGKYLKKFFLNTQTTQQAKESR